MTALNNLPYSPALAFIVVGVLSATASLFLVEAMSHTRGNARFQLQVEFATVAELCLGPKSHIILQVILFLALHSVNISSIIISCQVSTSVVPFADCPEYGYDPSPVISQDLCS